MKHQFKYRLITSLILAIALTACGGGSSDSGGGGAAALTMSGTAATGAPFADAAISIFDSTNSQVGSGTSLADGSYQITLTAGAKPPFVIQAVRDDLTLVSIAAADSGSTINITPITNLIASRLSASGNPANLAAELKANPALLDPVAVKAKVDEIVAMLKPLLDAVGASANPLTGSFVANGAGLDRALDSLLITITPSSPTTANIAVSVKQAGADDTQSAPILFISGSAATAPAPLPAITAANLLPIGTAQLIDGLLQRMTACFALPVAERVSNPNPISADATEILASACKTIFYNDDPSTYKGSGKKVGVGANKSFISIFTDGGNGVKFDRGSYEYGRDNPEKDFVIGYRQISVNGDVLYDTLVVRPDNAANPTKLSLIGNQYKYPGSVVAYHQLRSFTQPTVSGNDYYSTGYAFAIPNVNDGANTVQKVVVTSPKGNSITLLNGTPNSPQMGFVRNNVVVNNAFLRLGAGYVDIAKSGTPTESGQFFVDPLLEDGVIASYPAQISWKFEYYTGVDLNTVTLTKTQHFKTRARPLTIAELRTQGLANLTSAAIVDINAEQGPKGIALTGEVIELYWDVPATALMPTTINAWGYFNAKETSFKQSSNMTSSARSGIIYCKYSQTNCNTGNGQFLGGTMLQSIDLWARDPNGREFSHFYAFYQPAP